MDREFSTIRPRVFLFRPLRNAAASLRSYDSRYDVGMVVSRYCLQLPLDILVTNTLIPNNR